MTLAVLFFVEDARGAGVDFALVRAGVGERGRCEPEGLAGAAVCHGDDLEIRFSGSGHSCLAVTGGKYLGSDSAAS